MTTRILRLWWAYARLDAVLMTQSLKLFVSYFVSDAIVNIGGVATVLLLAERFEGIGRWSKPEIVFMLGYAAFVSAFTGTFAGYNVLFISRRIGRGQLDHLLAQPHPLWVALATEGFAPVQGAAALLPSGALVAWGLTSIGPPWSWYPVAVANFLGSAAVIVAYSYLWGSLAFWAPRGAEEVTTSAHSILGLRGLPLDGAGAGLTAVLMSILPIGFVGWFPARALVGLGEPWHTAVTPLAGLALGVAAVLVFRKGLRHYAGTGSQRYSTFGHRR